MKVFIELLYSHAPPYSSVVMDSVTNRAPIPSWIDINIVEAKAALKTQNRLKTIRWTVRRGRSRRQAPREDEGAQRPTEGLQFPVKLTFWMLFACTKRCMFNGKSFYNDYMDRQPWKIAPRSASKRWRCPENYETPSSHPIHRLWQILSQKGLQFPVELTFKMFLFVPKDAFET